MDQRTLIANGIAEDLQLARASVKLMFHLREMVRAQSSLVALANDFVWLAMRNSRDGAVIHLWKVLDSHKSARSLRWFVQTQSHLPSDEKNYDLQHLSTANGIVRQLATLRHQIFAHRGRTRSKDSAVLLANNIAESEFLGLIADAWRILRKHNGTHLSRQLDVNENDAISQIIDLDVYLDGTYRGDYGIEKLTFEVDGRVRGPLRSIDDL